MSGLGENVSVLSTLTFNTMYNFLKFIFTLILLSKNFSARRLLVFVQCGFSAYT